MSDGKPTPRHRKLTPDRGPTARRAFGVASRQPRLHNETASRVMKSHFVADVELTTLSHHESNARYGFSAGSFTLSLASTSFFAFKVSAYGPGLPIGLASLAVSLLFFGWGVQASLNRRTVLDEIRGITRPERKTIGSPFAFLTRKSVRATEGSSSPSESEGSQQGDPRSQQ